MRLHESKSTPHEPSHFYPREPLLAYYGHLVLDIYVANTKASWHNVLFQDGTGLNLALKVVCQLEDVSNVIRVRAIFGFAVREG